MNVSAQQITHPGTVRKQNEDRLLIDPEIGLYVVSDGLTHPFGAQCAELTCKEVQRYIKKHKQVIDAHEKETSSAQRQAMIELVFRSIEHASATIYQETQKNPKMRGVFSTVCVALLSRGYAFMGHLGDSRIYSIREGVFHPLTRDHTYLASMIAEGKTIDEAQKIDYCNNLFSAIGYQPIARPSIQVRELASNERLLLCTDGLSDSFDSGDFKEAAWAGAQTQDLPQILLDHALKRKANDNITAVILQWDHRKEERTVTVRDVRQKLGTIRGIKLFQHLGDRSLMKLLSLADMRELKPGETAIKKGEFLNEMYIVLKGELSLNFGHGPVPNTLKKGEVLGEMSLFDGSLPSATLVAREPTVLLTFHRDQLFRAMRDDPPFAARLMLGVLQVVIGRLREQTETDQDMKKVSNYSVVSILPTEKD